MREKTVLVLSIIIASGLGVSTAVFGVINMISVNSYNALMEDYEKLSGDYDVLLTNYSGILASYYNVNEEYQNLTEDYGDLNETYYILTGDNADLQGDYDGLAIKYAKLQSDYDDLFDQFNILQDNYTNLDTQYNNLLIAYNLLEEQLDKLNDTYQLLLGDYNELEDSYNYLNDEYQILLGDYNGLKTAIQQLILPVQYLVFAEAVRRYYKSIYFGYEYEVGKEYYIDFMEFNRDLILHDSCQKNSFWNVSNAFSDCLKFGNDTMKLADFIMDINLFNTYYESHIWWNYTFSDQLFGINMIHQWCMDTIEYEIEWDLLQGYENETWFHAKFPVETAFRSGGDFEDIPVLESAVLESCGFETAIAMIFDEDYSLNVMNLLVYIDDPATFYATYPSCPLWNLGDADPYSGFTWCWLDPKYPWYDYNGGVPFGDVPLYIQYYIDTFNYVSEDVCTIAICDVDGEIGGNCYPEF